MFKSITVLLLSLSLVACAAAERKPGSSVIKLTKYPYSKLTGWNNSNIHDGARAFQRSCAVLGTGKLRAEKLFSQNNNTWKQKCAGAKAAKDQKQFFERNFSPYMVSYKGSAKGKFTGYFEKEIEASLTKDKLYRYPIYRAPSDAKLLNLTRKEIENGALENKNLEIAYAKSAAKLFFLHIQGSGFLKLPDGKRVEIGFTAKNNAEYTSIGSYMLKEKLIEHGTADEIYEWLESHPVSGRTIMNMNDRYVFFAIKSGGPYGSLGVELTDRASLAVDTRYIPLGVPVWLQTTLSGTKQHFTKLMNAQDTGSGIKGPIRGDIFFGEGSWAASTASDMNSDGNYFILLPKEINPDLYF